MEMEINSSLIKKLRAKRLLSQEELATACGVSLRTIQRLEGEGKASAETLKSIASVFEVSHEYLLDNAPLDSEYHNVQLGTVIILGAVSVLIILTVLLALHIIDISIFLPGAIILSLICCLFSLMTTRVTAHDIQWCFTLGFWKKSVRLDAIKSHRQVRNKYWWGLGIRLIPDGWLYCVSGLDAVELKLENGKVMRIGTDQPGELNQALESAILKFETV